MTSNPNCVYHPNRDAVSKCEMCGKVVCIECKNIFHQQHSSTSHYGGTTHTTTYTTRHELCTPCFYDRKIKGVNSFGRKYLLIVFGVIFAIVAAVIFQQVLRFIRSWPKESMIPAPTYMLIGPIIFICVGIGLILFGIRNIITAPGKVAELEAKKAEFFKSLSTTPSTPKISVVSDSSKYTFCPNCGDKVDKDEKICDKCGKNLTK